MKFPIRWRFEMRHETRRGVRGFARCARRARCPYDTWSGALFFTAPAETFGDRRLQRIALR
jgi:hypothetical protein